MGKNLVCGFLYCQNIHFSFWALIYFLLIRIMDCLRNVYGFSFWSSIIKNFLLNVKHCVGDSPNLHCLSVTNFSLYLPAVHCVWDMFFCLRVFLVFLSVQPVPPATTVAAVQSDIPVVTNRPSSTSPVSLQLLRWACPAS